MSKTTNSSPKTMEELLASLSTKSISLQFSQEVEGTVVALLDKEIILELGTKSEGVLPKKDLSADILASLKVGDKLKAYVSQVENESGQTTLSIHKPVFTRPSFGFGGRGRNAIDWNRFSQVMNQNTKLPGNVMEINKGGLILEVENVRGFLPGSQIGIDGLGKMVGLNADIVGQQLIVTVIEIDQNNNRLIFSQKGQATPEIKARLGNHQTGEKVTGKVTAVYPFGILLDVVGDFGMVFPSDVTWEKMEDPTSAYQVGQAVEAVVVSIEPEYGRMGLSLKQLKDDPFTKMAENFQTDDVVSATVSSISASGISFTLKDGIEGFMPASKMAAGVTYEVGQKISCLVDSVDSNRRRVNLVPMLTSTEGLIYK